MNTVKDAERILRDVKGKSTFNLHMGASLSNLKDLSEALDIMSKETFNHHVSTKKNDFSNWVSEVLGDDLLADELLAVKTKETMLKKIDQRIVELEYVLSQSHITTKEILGLGAVDFMVGFIIGVLGGIVLASIL